MGQLFILEIILWVAISYLLGTISFGYIVGKDAGVDIRDTGSGNIGTTNALRTLGIKAGILTFVGDLLKALIPTLCATYLSVAVFGDSNDLSYVVGLIAGLGTVFGHNFPFWMKFKGGKGIAVTAGVTVAVSLSHSWFWIVAFLVFVVIVLLTGYVSLGSLCVPAWALPTYAILFERNNEYFVVILIISFLFTVLMTSTVLC